MIFGRFGVFLGSFFWINVCFWRGVVFVVWRARGGEFTSPAWLAISGFLRLFLRSPRFPLRSLILPRFLLLRFSAYSLALSVEWLPRVPSLSLAFPCFPLPSLAFLLFLPCAEIS